MKNVKFQLLFFLFLVMQHSAFSQLKGYPTCNNTTTVHSAGLLYMDETRAKVKDITFNSTNNHSVIEYENETFTSTTGTKFSVGDVVLIIKMKGNNVGLHESGIIGSIDLLNKKINLNSSVTNGDLVNWALLSPLSNEITQILKVPQYESLTISGGIVTCHSYDILKGHGGILTFMVGCTLQVSGGIINASAKGYAPEGITWGSGGNGGQGDQDWDNDQGGKYGCNNHCYIYNPNNTTVRQGNYGGQGDGIDPNSIGGIPSSNTGTPVLYPSSDYRSFKLCMGNAGYFVNGYGGGKGGDGGGHGAPGGTTYLNNGLWGAGSKGGDAQKGGDAGSGARGGGAILIKTNYLNVANTTTKYFFIDGEFGAPGGQGGKGGSPGKGGDGQQGFCYSNTEVHIQGGTGGYGATGVGANGGDGANGGSPGYIWILTKSNSNLTSSNISAKGGSGGLGGKAGYGRYDNCQDNKFVSTPLNGGCPNDFDNCFNSNSNGGYPIGVFDVYECNCDKAFCMLSQATSATVLNIGGVTTYNYYNSSNQLVAKYSPSLSILTGIYTEVLNSSSTRNNNYNCPMFLQATCNSMFDKITGSLTTYLGNVDLTQTSATNCINGSGGSVEVVFRNSASTSDLLKYESINRWLVDKTAPAEDKCLMDICYNNPIVDMQYAGSNGLPGLSASDGVINEPPSNSNVNFSDNLFFDDNANFKTINTTDAQNPNDLDLVKSIKIYPIPSKDLLYVDWEQSSSNTFVSEIELISIDGKTIEKKQFKFEEKDRSAQIVLTKLSEGIYFLKIKYHFNGDLVTYIKKIDVQK